MEKIFFNWSSGKDSAFALYKLIKQKEHSVKLLQTVISEDLERVTMHGLRQSLLLSQLKSIGLPYDILKLPSSPSMEVYNALMHQQTEKLKVDNFTMAGFGDIFLEDLRKYRETQLEKVGIKSIFPLWKEDTTTLIQDFTKIGFKTIVICINNDLLDKSFLGREIDENFIRDLPSNVDPCGENGEFHTFCYAGPIFSTPVQFTKGETTYKEYPNPEDNTKKGIGYYFLDLIPV